MRHQLTFTFKFGQDARQLSMKSNTSYTLEKQVDKQVDVYWLLLISGFYRV